MTLICRRMHCCKRFIFPSYWKLKNVRILNVVALEILILIFQNQTTPSSVLSKIRSTKAAMKSSSYHSLWRRKLTNFDFSKWKSAVLSVTHWLLLLTGCESLVDGKYRTLNWTSKELNLLLQFFFHITCLILSFLHRFSEWFYWKSVPENLNRSRCWISVEILVSEQLFTFW